MGFFAQELACTEPLLFPRSGAPSPGAGGFSVPFPGKPGFLGSTHHGHFSPSRKHLLCCLTKVCGCGCVGVQPLAMSAVAISGPQMRARGRCSPADSRWRGCWGGRRPPGAGSRG